MKTLIAAVTLLALVFPVEAKSRDLSDLRKWQDLNWQCYDDPRSDDDLDAEITKEDYDKTRRGKICLAAKALKKKLTPYPSKFRASDRKWLPVMDEWAHTYDPCLKRQWEEGEEAEHKAWCKRHDAAEKKLIAHGYCVYANGGVGRPSKDRKHCYVIDEPLHDPTR